MSTSRQITTLSSPQGTDQIPLGTLGYFRARNKQNAYALVIHEFQESGLSQADLAKRLGKGTDVVCRWLGAPGNWTLDTVSDLLFAISGAAPVYGTSYPLNDAPRNFRQPEWVRHDPIDLATEQSINRKAESTTSNVQFHVYG